MKKILLALSIAIFGFALVACENTDNGEENNTGSSTENITEPSTENTSEDLPEGTYGLGDTFQYDGTGGLMELTFGTDVTFTTIQNEFSDLDGESVIILPVTMTNVGEETGTLNMFDVNEFGTQGVSLEGVYLLVDGEDIRFGNELRAGATVESHYHLLYDGDGEYVLEFDNWSETIEVLFEIQK